MGNDPLPDDQDALKAIITRMTLEKLERDNAQKKLEAENADLKSGRDKLAEENASLKSARDGLSAENVTLKTSQEALTEENAFLTERVKLLEELAERQDSYLRALKRAQYGRRSEKLDADQLMLGLEDVEQATAALLREIERRKARAPEKKEKKQRRRNLGALPPELPREDRVLEPDDKTCATCGGALHEIGEDVSERLEYQPARFRVVRTRRPKYGCRCCEKAPVQAPAEPHLIEGGLPTESLVAHVVVSKFADFLPLYRLAQIFAREGVHLDRSTLADWVGAAAYELQPVYDRLMEIIKAGDCLFCDETPAPVLDPGRKQVKKGQFWALARDARPYGGGEPPAVIYLYQSGRSADAATEALKGYSGKVQVDGYAAYKKVMKKNREEGSLMLSFCMAHLRRKFYDELTSGYAPIAEEALKWIAGLYGIETQARGLPPDKRRAIRQEKAKPILEDFRTWLEHKLDLIPKRSKLAGSIRYAFNHWDGLLLYLDDGRLEIDSNTVERSMKPIALGRRNSLFAGHEKGAHYWAVLSSLVGTCKLNGVNPQVYFTDVLTKIVNGWAQSRIDDLLPFSYIENKS